VRPRTVLLREGRDKLNPKAYYIHEEEVPRAGVQISQSFQRTRWNLANTFEIYLQWRHRFAPGVTHNTEHVFGLELAGPLPVALAADEHVAYCWLPWREAAAKCFSWSNRDAILMLGENAS